MDEVIPIGDDSNESSLDVNLNLMDITSYDDDGGNVVPSKVGALVAKEVQENDPQKHAYENKPRNKTSPVWKDFKEVMQCGVKKAKCIHCKYIIGIPSLGATTQFYRHLNFIFIPRIAANKKQKVLTFDSKGGNVSFTTNFSYDHKKK
jgi:hypothetical protein